MSTIGPGIYGTGNSVHGAIRSASQRTQTDFDYLLAQANVESSLDPNAKASTSSAAGLFQFTNQTWLETLKRHGAEHGYSWAANAISSHGGRAQITDSSMANAIMQLRYDPQAASLMAGELANDNAAYLEGAMGRPADHTDLYLAHFLGADGARKFIAAHDTDPDRSAASIFPRAASANQGVFYADGRARSLGEVRDLFAAKLASSANVSASPSRQQAAYSSAASMPLTAPSSVTAGPVSRPSMSDILQSTFATGAGSASQQSHVNRAYERIARFGL